MNSSTRMNLEAHLPHLLEHEREALVESLRRDMREQQDRAQQPGQWQQWHGRNARTILSILQQLCPKQPAEVPLPCTALEGQEQEQEQEQEPEFQI